MKDVLLSFGFLRERCSNIFPIFLKHRFLQYGFWPWSSKKKTKANKEGLGPSEDLTLKPSKKNRNQQQPETQTWFWKQQEEVKPEASKLTSKRQTQKKKYGTRPKIIVSKRIERRWRKKGEDEKQMKKHNKMINDKKKMNEEEGEPT